MPNREQVIADRAPELVDELHASREAANAAAHRLAQFMSDWTRSPQPGLLDIHVQVIKLARLYEVAWLRWVKAREEWERVYGPDLPERPSTAIVGRR